MVWTLLGLGLFKCSIVFEQHQRQDECQTHSATGPTNTPGACSGCGVRAVKLLGQVVLAIHYRQTTTTIEHTHTHTHTHMRSLASGNPRGVGHAQV